MIRILDSASPHSGVGKYVGELFRIPSLSGKVEHVRLDRARGAVVSRPDYDQGPERILARLPRLLPPAYWAALASGRFSSPGIVHATHQNLPLARGRFRIVTVHDLFYATHPRDVQDRILSRTLYPFLPRYDLFLCDSADAADALRRVVGIPSDRIRVVPLVVRIPESVDPSRLPEPLQGRRFVLHVSSEEPRKNFDTLLRAFAAISDQPRFRDLLLVKVGRAAKASAREGHLALARELGIEDRLRILEGVSDEALESLYGAAQVMAMPSSSEGFGYPLAEALAVGCPAIAGDCPALREIGGEVVAYRDPRNARSWAEALEEALDRGDASGGEERVARARLFSREVFARRMEEVYSLV
ncbi:MAG: glycosyltransferase family 4 protein [Fibrobacteria bacterium]|nr:glycosyltransferase family 4 protein [Fibrobacteria bacterium]